nr:reverse transcriptase domain-containing protein [Tanacetum cinerariifolium]
GEHRSKTRPDRTETDLVQNDRPRTGPKWYGPELPSAFINHSRKSALRDGATRKAQGTPSRRRDLKKRHGTRHTRGMSESPKQGAVIPSHQGKEIRKENWCSKGWEKVYSTGSETRGRVHPHTQTIQGVDHTTVAAETLKAATSALAQEKQSLLSKKHHNKRASSQRMKALAKKERWRPPIVNESDHFRHGNSKKPDISQTSRREASETNKGRANQWKRPGESGKKGETSRNEKPLAILMVQPWDRVAKQKITQTFSPESVISFPPLREEDETEGLMISEAEMEGHFVHRMYVDEGSSSEILYEHCFNRFCSEVRSRTISATTPLVGFSEEIIWPLGQISLLVKIGDEEYSTSAWMNFMIPADMIGVPRHIAKHRLNIREGCLPVKQKKKGQAPERNKAIYKEVKKLVDAGIIKEVHYHNWLSNPVIVKKHDGGQRMCVDFKYLNKACPKDGYPLSEIDWKVESLCGNKLAGTWKYMDDLVIKIRTKQEVIRDIEETFKTLREINMKLNLKKCTFGMREGMFLGYKVNADGLKVCPNKVEAVLSLSYPKCLKYVQRLNGKLASLNRFMSKSAEKSLPFFKTLKKCTKKSDFQWNAEAKMAFKQMKTLIAELPMLTALKGKEELVIYLVAAKESISAVLMTKRDGKQTPIYFVSHFIVERPEDDPPDTPIEDKEELPDPCILFTDRSSCIDGSGAGLIITSLEEMKFAYALRFRFNATNNDAEYEALIVGLRVAKQMGVKNLQANVDSRLVANQRRAQKTDALSKMASTSFAHLRKQVLVEEIKEKSINEREVLAVVEEDRRTWMTPIYDYLTEEFFQKKRGRLRFERNMQHARRSKIRGGQIFKIRNRTPITSSWPFYKWGIDIAGPFPEGPGKVKFLIVAIDYFTKLIEAKPMATIMGAHIKKFV